MNRTARHFKALAAALIAALLCCNVSFAQDKPVPLWNVNYGDSALTFNVTQMGAVFTGRFTAWKAQIKFDAERLNKSSIQVEVDTSSVETGDRDRDDNIRGKDWFDVKAFPTATFKSTQIFLCSKGGSAYCAEGSLTIRNVTLPVSLDFTLKTSPHDKDVLKAEVKGGTHLDRSKFTLGSGQWADTSVIANEVPVAFNLVAFSSPEKTSH